MSSGISVSTAELIQLQSQAARFALHARQKVRSHFHGAYRSHIRGRGMDFEESRVYQPGDDVRCMDWRVTARTGTAHTKVFCEERELPVWLVVDLSQSMFFGTRVAFKSVIAAKIAALLAFAAVDQGDRVGGLLFNEEVLQHTAPRARNAGVLPLLKQLSHMTQANSYSPNPQMFTAMLKRLQTVANSGGLMIILSDFAQLTPEHKPYLYQLSKRHRLIAGLIYDSLEQNPPAANRYVISDGIERAWLDTTRSTFCKHYQQHFAQRFTQVKTIMQQCQAGWFSAATHQPLSEIITGIL